jgi:hypothetical protein
MESTVERGQATEDPVTGETDIEGTLKRIPGTRSWINGSLSRTENLRQG